jgi:hypothetical protein
VISNLLAAIGGGLSGLGTGLQYNQQRKMAEDEASARRRSEALQALLTQDQLGLVPESAASPMPMVKPQLGVPQSGNVGEMLKALQSAPPAPTAAPDTRRRVSLPGVDGRVQEYVIDPTQSRDARNARMASDMEGQRYQRQRGDVLADRDTELQTAATQRDTDNRRAFATFQAAFPKNALAAQYNPSVDYGAITQRTDALDRQDRGFQQARTLQDRQFGQARSLAQIRADATPEGKPLPAGDAMTLADNGSTISQLGQLDQMLTQPANKDAVGRISRAPIISGVRDFFGADDNTNEVRAILANVGNMTIKDISGATVTLSEDRRLAPLIPSQDMSLEQVQARVRSMLSILRERDQNQRAALQGTGYRVPQSPNAAGTVRGDTNPTVNPHR